MQQIHDLSPLQFEIFELWRKKVKIVVVAGDPNQAIYGFQGATPEFLNNFQATHDILLSISYRLPQKIIDYTKNMMEGTPWISEMQPHVSVTKKSGEGSVERITGWDELASKLPDGLGKVFVLVRTRKQLEKVSQELIKQEIFHQIIGCETVLDSLIHSFYNICMKLKNEKTLSKTEIRILLDKVNPLFDSDYVVELHDWVYATDKQEVFDIPVINEMEYDMYSTFMQDKLSSSNEIMEYFKQNITDPKLKMVINQGILKNLNLNDMICKSQNVELKTIHQSKGEEADLVVLVDQPTQYEINGNYDENEERRIWYVGVTRTKQKLIILSIQSHELGIYQTKYLLS